MLALVMMDSSVRGDGAACGVCFVIAMAVVAVASDAPVALVGGLLDAGTRDDGH